MRLPYLLYTLTCIIRLHTAKQPQGLESFSNNRGLMNLQIITSQYATEIDGETDKEVEVSRGGFLERMFDPDPAYPLWAKTKKKIIKVPYHKPVMYMMGNKLIAHPSLVEEIKRKLMTPNEIVSYSLPYK